MFEKRHEALLPRRKFLARFLRSLFIASGVILCSLALGILGYHHFEHLSWLDSLLNAAMILSAMGPVTPLQTDAGKLFASLYALFSGVVFITVVGVLFAPLAHRFLHKFHLEIETEDSAREKPVRDRARKQPEL
jgi:ABC-type glycerol-3-phosphate transport system permease component